MASSAVTLPPCEISIRSAGEGRPRSIPGAAALAEGCGACETLDDGAAVTVWDGSAGPEGSGEGLLDGDGS